MKKDIPEIGDLTQGINDSDIILTHKLPEMLEKSSGLQDRTNGTSEKKTETDGEPIHLSPSKEVEDYWTGFLKNLEISDESNVKSERLVCRLDRDLADSLDDSNIWSMPLSVHSLIFTFYSLCRFAEKRNHCLQISIKKIMRKKRTNWTEQKIAVLIQLYPIETTTRTAEVLGMCERAVKEKARSLGLKKAVKSRWMEHADYVRNHFAHRSYAEIGKELGISREYARRIAVRMGLKRTALEDFKVLSRIHSDIMRRERRRVIFGLSPITRIKVVSNRARVRLRSWLKSKGYIAGEEYGILYYTDDLHRIQESELRGAKLGFRFLPYPSEETIVLSNLL